MGCRAAAQPHSLQSDLEDRAVAAGAACDGRSIEIAIAPLDQTCPGLLAVAAAPGEGVQNGLGPARRDLENRTDIGAAPFQCRSIEVAVAAQDHPGFGTCAIAAAPGKGVQNGLGSARRELEDRAQAAGAALI